MPNQVEGVIIETDGQTARVRCSIHSDCENCGVCPGANAMVIEAIDTQGAKPGDSVVVESRESNMLLTAFMVFIFPFLAIGCGIWLGYYLSHRFAAPPVLLMTLGGLILGMAAVLIIKYLDRSLESGKPVIRSIK